MQVTTFTPESIEEFTRLFERLFDENDADAMTAWYAEDGRIAVDGMVPVQGHVAIQQFWQYAIESAGGANVTRTIRLDEVKSFGELGYAVCIVDVEIPGATPSDSPTKVSSWDTTLWRQGLEGAWEIVIDISVHLPQSSTAP